MKILVDEYWQKFTNGLAELDVIATTVGGALEQFFKRFPQVYVRLVDNELDLALRSLLRLNGEIIWRAEDNLKEVTESCELKLNLEIPHGNSKILKWFDPFAAQLHGVVFEGKPIGSLNMGAWMDPYGRELFGDEVVTMAIGVAMVVVGVIVGLMFGWTGIGGAVAFMFISQGLALMMQSVVMLLAPGMPVLGDMSFNNSPTYTFGGMKNSTASGTPINIIYGEHRVGGQILNAYSTYEHGGEVSDAVTKETIMMQVGLCEGEVEGISDVEINKFPASIYAAVDLVTDRLGYEEQPSIPGFNRTESTSAVAKKITNTTPSIVFSKPPSGDTVPVYGYIDPKEKKIIERYCGISPSYWERIYGSSEGGG